MYIRQLAQGLACNINKYYSYYGNMSTESNPTFNNNNNRPDAYSISKM